MEKNKTLIIGASLKPERYAYKAAQKLIEHGHDIYLVGNRTGTLFGKEIHTESVSFPDVDTVTLYVSAKNQTDYYDYIISLQPRRVIFNPGTENPKLESLLQSHDIVFERACTLVLLGTNAY
ncbi:MAG: CoA-binding protein [Bacteroidales bacterium]|jgi:predicted CoA-binding protein|nr:CoA-binding protein [Bacteroidales bacterium]